MPHDKFGCTGLPDVLELRDGTDTLIAELTWDNTSWFAWVNDLGYPSPFWKVGEAPGAMLQLADGNNGWSEETTPNCAAALLGTLTHGGNTYRVYNPDFDDGGGGGGPCELEPYTEEAGAIYGDSYEGLTLWDDLTITSVKAERSSKLTFDQFNLNLNLIAEDQIITGVQIDITGKTVTSGTVTDQMVQLKFGGTPAGDYKSGGSWASTTTYGGPGDLWGLDEITLTDMSQTGSGFFIQGLSAGAAEYSIESATITVYTGSGLDNCGNKRGYCVPIGTGTATGKLVEVQVASDGDDGTWTPAYWGGSTLIFGYIGAIP